RGMLEPVSQLGRRAALMRLEQLSGDAVFVIRDFLSADECDRLIAASEQAGYEEAPITTALGPVMNRGVRDNARVIHDSPALADQLFERARPLLPEAIGRWRLAGFNERWRYYRYDVGEKFAPHYDGSFRRDEYEHSELTFMLYLNDDFLGGETNFFL